MSGCASVTQRCAIALLEVSAQVCVEVVCDEGEDGDIVDETEEQLDERLAEERRRRLDSEVAPPDWQPSDGGCDIVEDDSGVRVACADGTRAVFVGRGGDVESAPPLVEKTAATDEGEDCDVVRQGVDINRDGALTAVEVTGRTVDCEGARGAGGARPTLQGHLAIHGPRDVARLAGRRALTGGLHVRSAALVRLEVPQLQSLGGTLRVDRAPALEALRLPNLASVGGDVVIARAQRLTLVVLPSLSRVGGSFTAVENPQLPQRDVEELVFRLSRHGFSGPVELAGNHP